MQDLTASEKLQLDQLSKGQVNAVTPDLFTNPNLLAAYSGSAAADLEQLLRMEPTISQHEMLIDSDPDVLSMWSAPPSNFQLADWESYLMTSVPSDVSAFAGFAGFTPPSPSPYP